MSLFKKQSLIPAEETAIDKATVFCALQPLDTNSNVSLEEQGYIKIPNGALEQVGAIAQYIPAEAASLANAGLYKAVFDEGLGVLQKSAQHPGFYLGNVVSPDTNNDIRAVAAWQEVSASPQIALGIFTAVSFVTGQYFMAKTNKRLSAMSESISEIQQYLTTKDFNTLVECREYFLAIQDNLSSIMGNDFQRQSRLTMVEEKKGRCLTIANTYRDKVNQLSIKQGSKKQVKESIDNFSHYLMIYRTAMQLYGIGIYLETVLAQNTDASYLHNMSDDIGQKSAAFKENLQSWEAKYSECIEGAKAFRMDRFLLNQPSAHFWDVPISKAKDAVLVKRGNHSEEAKNHLKAVIDVSEDEHVIEAVQGGLGMLDRIYNHSVSAVISGTDLYIKPSEDAS